MGCADEVPGAIRPENVAAARDTLRQALALMVEKDAVETEKPTEKSQEKPSSEQDDEEISMSRRAQPLLELLDKAASKGNHVVWE